MSITRAETEQRHNPDDAEEFISTFEILWFLFSRFTVVWSGFLFQTKDA
jgi:hypothetical protein